MIALLTAAALTLGQARALADERNGALAASRAQVAVAQAGVEAAGQLPNPTLALSYGADDPKLQGSLDVKLPFLGQRGAAIGSAEAQARVASAEAAAARAKLHAQVRRAYAAYFVAREQQALAGEAAKIAADLAHVASERFRTGGAPQLEVEQAQLAAKRAERDALDREADAEAARQELNAALGAQVDEVAAPPAAEVPAADALVARIAQHPELASLRAQEDAAAARAHEERVAVAPLPVVSVTAERFYDDPAMSWGLRAGVAFDVPLLSWNRGRVHEQEATARAAAMQAQAALQRLEGEVRAARARWAAASGRAAFYGGELVASARRVLEMAQAGYRIGRTSAVAVLQAQSDLSSARARAADAALEAQRALADLEEATGADL